MQKVLGEAQISLSDLGAVSVSSGPGSYTGLRIGVSTAKGFCYALGIPLIAVDALHSLAQQALIRHPGKNLCAMIDARRMEVFSSIFSSEGQVLKEITADILEETTYSEFEPFVAVVLLNPHVRELKVRLKQDFDKLKYLFQSFI